MRPRIPRSVALATALAVLVNFLGLRSAYAFLGVGDTGDVLLADLVANSVQALAQSAEQLKQMRESYETAQNAYRETKKYAGYAEEAVRTTQAFRNLNSARFGSRFTEDLRTAFPEVAYVEGAIRDRTLNSNAGLGYAATYCLADYVSSKDACTRFKQAAETEKLAAMINAAFGSNRKGPPQTKKELQAEIIRSQIDAVLKELEQQDAVLTDLQAKQAKLRDDCLRANASDTSADCKDAQQLSQLLAAEVATVSARMSIRRDRLATLQLAQQNAEADSDVDQARARHDALEASTKQLNRESIRIKTDGFTFSD